MAKKEEKWKYPFFRKSREISRWSHMISGPKRGSHGFFWVSTKVSSASRNVAPRKFVVFYTFSNKYLRVCKLWRRNVISFRGAGRVSFVSAVPQLSCGLVCPPQFDVLLPRGSGDQQLLPGASRPLQPALLRLCQVFGSGCSTRQGLPKVLLRLWKSAERVHEHLIQPGKQSGVLVAEGGEMEQTPLVCNHRSRVCDMTKKKYRKRPFKSAEKTRLNAPNCLLWSLYFNK